MSKSLILSLSLCIVTFFAACTSQEEVDPIAPVETTDVTDVDVEGVDNEILPEEAISEVTETEVKETLDQTAVNFGFDRFVLTSEAKTQLRIKAEFLLKNHDVRLRIEGHCDNRGSDQYNMNLGLKRAQATKDFLMELGVKDDQLTVISLGEKQPIDPSDNDEAWAANRRTEFIIEDLTAQN